MLILLLKWESLTQTPVWDTAMGLFPAALTLAESGFDLLELLRMPKFPDGGPNVHSTSVVTLITALVLMITGGGETSLVVLHLLHFGVAAAALTILFRFARPVLGVPATAVLCLSVLLYPVFLVQVGYLYMEVPLFLCAVASLAAWVNGRFWSAALWAALALAVKETGIIVPATLGIAVLFEGRSIPARVWKAVQIVSPSVIWWGSTTLLAVIAASGRPDSLELIPSFGGRLGSVWHNLDHFLLRIPDLLVFLYVFLLAALRWRTDMVRAVRQEPIDPVERNVDQRVRLPVALSGILILCFLLLVLVVLPVVAQYPLVLPRYYVIILPFLLLWIGYAAQGLLSERMKRPALLTFAILSLFFALNRNGRFYPSDINIDGPGNDFAVTERSHAYVRLDAIQREAVAYLETLPAGTPVYYGQYEHYLFSYPALGYAKAPLSNGHSLSLEPLTNLLQAVTPVSCAYLLYNYPWLGGEKMLDLFRLTNARDDLTSEVVREFRDGRYAISIVRTRYSDAECPV